ncbi:MAG TPA: type II toxin-antitoxin system mRNA interferase toxin, RelE/StbE family [Candidatus Limnocylindria bacterium]|nr:type II toxin-antitoxin system mRNA interferase toxin, RelE/StbE family [Candidatus Limnocylindria bacterium]
MKTTFHKRFVKQYAKLPVAQKRRFEKAILLFRNEPNHTSLYNHSLTGDWTGYRSIAFGGDWRAHYLPKGKDEALFVAIGTHSQLYK